MLQLFIKCKTYKAFRRFGNIDYVEKYCKMDLKHAKELDVLMNKSLRTDWVGAANKIGVAKTEEERDKYRRENLLCEYISVQYGFMERDISNAYRINGAGIIALEVSNNKPFEEMFDKEESQKELIKIEKERLENDRLFERDFKEKSLKSSKISPIVAAIIGGVIAVLLTYLLSRIR